MESTGTQVKWAPSVPHRDAVSDKLRLCHSVVHIFSPGTRHSNEAPLSEWTPGRAGQSRVTGLARANVWTVLDPSLPACWAGHWGQCLRIPRDICHTVPCIQVRQLQYRQVSTAARTAPEALRLGGDLCRLQRLLQVQCGVTMLWGQLGGGGSPAQQRAGLWWGNEGDGRKLRLPGWLHWDARWAHLLLPGGGLAPGWCRPSPGWALPRVVGWKPEDWAVGITIFGKAANLDRVTASLVGPRGLGQEASGIHARELLRVLLIGPASRQVGRAASLRQPGSKRGTRWERVAAGSRLAASLPAPGWAVDVPDFLISWVLQAGKQAVGDGSSAWNTVLA